MKVRTIAAEVNTEKCAGCGVRVELCPPEVISLNNAAAIIDEDTCIECGLCVDECPNDAIGLLQIANGGRMVSVLIGRSITGADCVS